ncbi:hypothetical protein [Bacteroides sp.]|uniref:hypothetical protein n=1 Tax=Bacteroides sp. TaxID=29523 RepID=UPI002585F215|nr:hypothetical protein [Bacteroides sp.]
MKLLLQYKILLGYLILTTVLGGVIVIFIHERHQLRDIELETVKIRSLRLGINKMHRSIIELAIRGESVVVWDKADYQNYLHHRLQTDSILQTLEPLCREYVQSNQIDTLRHLLAEKETHLLHIMQNIKQRNEREEMLANQLPEVAKRATRVRTVEQKKKGIAGFFGMKKEIRIMPLRINSLLRKNLSVELKKLDFYFNICH